MKTKNGLFVYIQIFFKFPAWSFFRFLFNFRNKFIKQFAISKDTFLNFGLEIFCEEKVICVNLRL